MNGKKINKNCYVRSLTSMSASSKSRSDFGDETDVRLLLLLDACKASEIDVETSAKYSENDVDIRHNVGGEKGKQFIELFIHHFRALSRSI